jgi:hypothetical protein
MYIPVSTCSWSGVWSGSSRPLLQGDGYSRCRWRYDVYLYKTKAPAASSGSAESAKSAEDGEAISLEIGGVR